MDELYPKINEKKTFSKPKVVISQTLTFHHFVSIIVWCQAKVKGKRKLISKKKFNANM